MSVNRQEEFGPVYGVRLIESLPIGTSMQQAMPTRDDLTRANKVAERVVAGYEVLLAAYQQKCSEKTKLESMLRRVVIGNWSITEVQKLLGDLT